MDRNARTAAKIAAIIVATVIVTLLAYYICSALAGHQLATASNQMNYSQWQDKFFSLVIVTGAVTGICSLVWFILARWIFKINMAVGIGKRTIWAILAAVSLIACIIIPRTYSVTLGIKINGLIIALLVVFFTVVGYWILSIFTTPKAFKYTPVGALLFARKK